MAIGKKLHHKSLLGQLGANFIEKVISDMGQVWRPTTVHDTGVDGTIEFRNPVTGEVTNQLIQVQSKATDNQWESEAALSFIYRVRKEDLEYWLRGNLPVILVVSRPKSSEAYWVNIKEYFSTQQSLSACKIVFNKNSNSFDVSCLSALQKLAVPIQAGNYSPPLQKEEVLISNLLGVSHYPKTLYVAETRFRKSKDLNDWLIERNIRGRREWILRNERIYSFYDLTNYPWIEVCDRGTVEDFDTSEWADSDDPDKLREWVELLNVLLKTKLSYEGIVFNAKKQFRSYYFKCFDGKSRQFKYASQLKSTDREVVKPIIHKKTNEIYCFKHSALQTGFHRFDGMWYLHLSPTYYYTKNGLEPFKFHDDLLSGIKRLENNASVLGQTIMWERLLTESSQTDLYKTEYKFIKFESLIKEVVDFGIDDSSWLPVSEDVLIDELERSGLLL